MSDARDAASGQELDDDETRVVRRRDVDAEVAVAGPDADASDADDADDETRVVRRRAVVAPDVAAEAYAGDETRVVRRRAVVEAEAEAAADADADDATRVVHRRATASAPGSVEESDDETRVVRRRTLAEPGPEPASDAGADDATRVVDRRRDAAVPTQTPAALETPAPLIDGIPAALAPASDDETRVVERRRHEALDDRTAVVAPASPSAPSTVDPDRIAGDRVSAARFAAHPAPVPERPAPTSLPSDRIAFVPGATGARERYAPQAAEPARVERQVLAPAPDRHGRGAVPTTGELGRRRDARPVILIAVGGTVVLAALVAVVAFLALR